MFLIAFNDNHDDKTFNMSANVLRNTDFFFPTLLANVGVAHSKRRYMSRLGGRGHFNNSFWFAILPRQVVCALLWGFVALSDYSTPDTEHSLPELSCARVIQRFLLVETHQ